MAQFQRGVAVQAPGSGKVEQGFQVRAADADLAGFIAGELARVVLAQDVLRPGNGGRGQAFALGHEGGVFHREEGQGHQRDEHKYGAGREPGRRLQPPRRPGLRRDGVTQDGEKARLFGPETEDADPKAFAERTQDDRHHFRFIVSPDDAAEMACLSPTRFAHVFKEQIGLPFSRYMLWRKLTRAMVAVSSERTIAAAAHAADFADAAHLTRTFYQMVGMAPSVLMRGVFVEIASPFSRLQPDSGARPFPRTAE